MRVLRPHEGKPSNQAGFGSNGKETGNYYNGVIWSLGLRGIMGKNGNYYGILGYNGGLYRDMYWKIKWQLLHFNRAIWASSVDVKV